MNQGDAPRGGRRWIKWVLIGGGIAIAVVVVVVVVVIFFFFRSLSQPGEATAEYVPSNALLYTSINLRPGAGQLGQGKDVIDLLRTEDFIDKQDELLEEIEDETDIHPLDDVTPWLGTDVSFVILDADGDFFDWVLMVQVSDRDAVEDFLSDLLPYLEDELYTGFDEDEIDDADVWVADDEDIAIGLTDNYLIFGDSEDTVEDIVDNMNSPPSRSLAAKENFIAARESLPDDRVMFVFAQSEDILESFEEYFGPFSELDDAEEWVDDNAPEYFAASASFIEKGLRFDVVAPAPDASFSIESGDALETVNVLPEDTLVLIAAAGIPEVWQELRDWLEDNDPDAKDDLDEFLEDIEDETGIDLESDVIESLTGAIAVALLPSDVELESLVDDLGGGAVEAVMIAGPQDPYSIEDAIEELLDLLEDEGYDTDRDSIGDYEFTSIEMEQFDSDFEDYEAGILVTDEWVALSTTLDSMENFHESLTGDTRSLKSSDKFSELDGLLPGPLHYLVYADLAGILEMVEDGLDEDDLSDYEEDVRPFVENLSGFVLASSITDEEWRFTMVITLDDR